MKYLQNNQIISAEAIQINAPHAGLRADEVLLVERIVIIQDDPLIEKFQAA